MRCRKRASRYATTPRPSIGNMQWRAVRIDLLTLIGAVLASASNARFSLNSMKTLSPHSSCTSGDPGWHAAIMSVMACQLLDIRRYRGGDVFGLCACRSDAHRDHLAHVANLAGREHGLDRILESFERRR